MVLTRFLAYTRREGYLIILVRCDDEIAELEVVVHRLRILDAANLNLSCGDMAVLYRANSQSRAVAESLLCWSIPYVLVGRFWFYYLQEFCNNMNLQH